MDDRGVLLLSLQFLEWQPEQVPRRMNNRRSSSKEWFDTERGGMIVYGEKSFDAQPLVGESTERFNSHKLRTATSSIDQVYLQARQYHLNSRGMHDAQM